MSQFALQVFITASMKNVNNTGQRMSPCLTSIIHFSVCVTLSTVNLTIESECKACNRLISFGGTKTLAITCHRSSLGTLSVAVTKSKRNTHDSFLCSHLFLRAIFIVKKASVHSLPYQVESHIEIRDLNLPESGGVSYEVG